MWVMTTGGFVSAVQEKGDPTALSVRSRDRESLQTLVDGVEMLAGQEAPVIRFGEGTDYPYRVTVSREAFAKWLAFEATEYITYSNFKDAVSAQRGVKWHDALMNVWVAMLRVTDKRGLRHPAYVGKAAGRAWGR